MSWGGTTNGHSSVPLNYKALDTALTKQAESKLKWNQEQYRHILFLYQRYVTAYRLDPETIAFKLYRTEIIHYHTNGLRTLYGAGWFESQITRHWFWRAGISVQGITPNWSPKQYVVWNEMCVFYDGMQINERGNIVSKHKPMLIRKPNAEAKALRKQLTALAKIYRTFALMHAGSDQKFDGGFVDQDVTRIDPATHKFDLDLYKQLQHRTWEQERRQLLYPVPPLRRMQRALTKAYEAEVYRRGLFDVIQGEES